MDVGSINKAIRAACLPGETETSADRARVLRTLWDVFTTHLHHALLTHGRCALVARVSGAGVQLFVEDGEGHLRGAFADPIGIAVAMVGRGLGRIDCDAATGSVSDLETVLRVLMGERAEMVGDAGVFALGDRFIDAVTDDGLPVLSGIDYERTDAQVPVADTVSPCQELGPADFAARVRSSRTSKDVLRLLRTQVLPYRQGDDLQPYVRTLMSAARYHNETRDDVAAGIELWTEAHAVSPAEEDWGGVVAIMMSVARKRASAELPPAQRDVAGAIRIYEAVRALGVSEDQDRRLVKTMMAVANLYTDLSMSPERRDIPGAIALWESILGMVQPPEEKDYVRRSMMKVANMLTDLRMPDRPIDVDNAALIWCSVADHARSDEDWERTVRTMMAMANRLTDPDQAPGLDDYRVAVRLWRTTYILCLERDEEQALRVVRTMMAVANRLTDFTGQVSEHDLQCAIVVWRGVAEGSHLDDDRVRAIRTMMALAGKRIGAYSDRDSVCAALLLWQAAHGCSAGDDGRFRVLKTIMDLADRYPAICSHAIDLLRGERATFDDEGFSTDVLAGLLYYQQEYDAVVALVDDVPGQPSNTLAALRADALRKLGRYGPSIAACDELIRRCNRPGSGRVQHEALVSALCCRGHASLELGRTDAGKLTEAERNLRLALDVAGRQGVPLPPRAHTGLGYLRQLQGQLDEAEECFSRARHLDADNRKATTATAPSPGTAGAADTDSGPGARKRALMTEAHKLNELHNDVDGAIARWTEAYALRAPGDDSSAVVAIMMSVARKRASTDLTPEHRDVAGAARIYEAVFRLDTSPDQDLRLIRTMMATANRFTDMSMPSQQRDVPGAITLWESLLSLGLPEHEDARIRRTMMGVAAMLTDVRAPGREIDVDSAAAIWRSVHDHAADDEDRARVVRTMSTVADLLGRVEVAPGQGAVSDAERLKSSARTLERAAQVLGGEL